ncbi:uncharacterized protein KQ657_004505 [Scheffersomyces spartinae]|uniref:Uncharacterized protein n=1 Tax=Scheffersomyces spartinae TaxID=45513 RepID=A0A9P7VBB6_9ASCO|nr:uncharacterized protein KQ657_004505 [Scheffersomyces spartinae]KAG7194824.1 hypothetical protein KQ657_004505 [Scheffersomyces spartinae]
MLRSIGGVIVIAGILLLYVFVRRKRKQFTNQSPDFNDSTSTDNFFLGAPPAKEGLPSPNNDRTRLGGSDEKIFNNSDTELGGRDSSSGGFLKNIIAMKGFKRLSGQNQDTTNNDDLTLFSGPPGSNGTPVKTVGGARAYSANKDSDIDQVETPTHTNFRNTSQDYTYRGVTNSNNLDSVFKKLGGPTTGNSTNSNSNGAPTIINGPISPTSVYASNAASNRNSQLGADDFYFNEDSRTPFRNPLVDYRGHKAPYPTNNDQYRGFGQSRFQENFE